ncbi:uncharacterized protein V6R79_003889 [Siganus canaliculatus]
MRRVPVTGGSHLLKFVLRTATSPELQRPQPASLVQLTLVLQQRNVKPFAVNSHPGHLQYITEAISTSERKPKESDAERQSGGEKQEADGERAGEL